MQESTGLACKCKEVNLESRFEYVVDESHKDIDVTWSLDKMLLMISPNAGPGLTLDAWVDMYVYLMAKVGIDVHEHRCNAYPIMPNTAAILRTYQRRSLTSTSQRVRVLEKYIQCRHDVRSLIKYYATVLCKTALKI